MHKKNIIALVKKKHQSSQSEIADCLNSKKATVTKNNYARQKKKRGTKCKIGKAE